MSNNKFKVLIVEDEANICSFIETLLTTNDYQALVAHTCTMGLTLFASHNPDLVILDLGLPDRDGLEFIRTVRQKYMTPIVVLSARTDEMDKIEALDLGANDYITKPFSPVEVAAHALRLLGQGMKVCVEISMMAADAGLVELHEPIVAVAGTGHGADTAVVIRPAPTAEFLDSKVDRIICMPRQG